MKAAKVFTFAIPLGLLSAYRTIPDGVRKAVLEGIFRRPTHSSSWKAVRDIREGRNGWAAIRAHSGVAGWGEVQASEGGWTENEVWLGASTKEGPLDWIGSSPKTENILWLEMSVRDEGPLAWLGDPDWLGSRANIGGGIIANLVAEVIDGVKGPDQGLWADDARKIPFPKK